MSDGREDEMDQWIFHEGVRKSRLGRGAASSQHTAQAPVGSGLDAMEKVALYFGDRPDLPMVELGQIKEHEITLTFGDDVTLEAPFYQVSWDYRDQWAISHVDALGLATGDVHGHQTMALTAIGHSLSGSKILFNTNRWQILGSVGMARFTTSFMIGQVMEHATEPWTRDHHLWLVGYRELAQKLITFLAPYHDESRFHVVESLDQITADDLTGTSATIYVMGSSPATAEARERLGSESVGMITDTVVTEVAMFISEDEDGGATVVNAGTHGLRIWPNLVSEGDSLYEAMESAWSSPGRRYGSNHATADSVATAEFPITRMTGDAQQSTDTAGISIEELEALLERESFMPDHEQETVDTGPVEVVHEKPLPALERSSVPVLTKHFPAVESSVSLFGSPRIHGADGCTAGGKSAEAVAYLLLNGRSAQAADVITALWPEVDPAGRVAHTRGNRVANTIEDVLPGLFRGGSTWDISPVSTDLEAILAALANSTTPQELQEACAEIAVPLQGCAEWADEHRDRIVKQLRHALEEITDTALENDQFEMAKTARQLYKKL